MLMFVKLQYKQRERKPDEFIERFGMKTYQVGIGFVDYEQEEVVALNEVDARIKELKSFSNRNYHSFTKEVINN